MEGGPGVSAFFVTRFGQLDPVEITGETAAAGGVEGEPEDVLPAERVTPVLSEGVPRRRCWGR